jgi:outer membrane lipoprotein-sorting protein
MSRLSYGTGWTVLAAVLGCAFARGEGDPDRPNVDKKAVDIMDRVEAKVRAASTIEVVKGSTIRQPTTLDPGGWRVIKVQVKRPNLYRVEALEMDSAAYSESLARSFRVSNGSLRLSEQVEADSFDMKERKVIRLPKDKWKRNRFIEKSGEEDIYVWDDDNQTLAGLYVVDDEHPGIGSDWRHHKIYEPTFDSIRYLGKEDWKGKSYEIVEWWYRVGINPPAENVTFAQKVYVGSDTLVHRVVTKSSKGATYEEEFRSITLNPQLPDSLFTINETGVKKRIWNRTPKYNVGNTLPDLTLPAVGDLGDSITLSKALNGKKGALIWLWAYW